MLDYFSAYSSISSIFFSHSQFFFLFQRIKSSDDMKPPVCYMLCEISVNTFQIQNRIVNIDWRFLLDNSDVFFLLPSSHALAWWKWSDCHHHHRRYQRHQYQKPLPISSIYVRVRCRLIAFSTVIADLFISFHDFLSPVANSLEFSRWKNDPHPKSIGIWMVSWLVLQFAFDQPMMINRT